MNIFQSIFLGIVQGLTEFIPISSSGHLIIIPKVFNWVSHSLVFDTTLHLGTSAALIAFFFKDIKKILIALFEDINYKEIIKNKDVKHIKFQDDSKLGFKLLLGAIPAVILGLLLNDYFEFLFREIHWVIIFLTVGSLLMYFAEYLHIDTKMHKIKNLNEISYLKAFIVGVFQSLALFPGVSRSGATISGSMFLGLSRENSAKFSFLLSIPIILGAGIYQLISTPFQNLQIANLLLGLFFSFISGIFAIKFLLKYLKTNKLYPFVIYRVILAIILLFFVSM